MHFYIHNIERSEGIADKKKDQLTMHFRVHLIIEGRAAIVQLEVSMTQHYIDFSTFGEVNGNTEWMTPVEQEQLHEDLNHDFIYGENFTMFYDFMKAQFQKKFGIVHSIY